MDETLESLVYWDYSNSTLIGKIRDNVFYVFNSSFFEYCNQYGSIVDNGNVIVGGIFDYLIDKENTNIKSITYAFPLSFQADEIDGETIRFCAFQCFIPVRSTIFYFIAIANTEVNTFNNYAIFSKSTFRGSKGTIQTFPVLIQFVSEKDDTFQNFGSLFFKYTDNIVKIYITGYEDFLRTNKKTTEIPKKPMLQVLQSLIFCLVCCIQGRPAVVEHCPAAVPNGPRPRRRIRFRISRKSSMDKPHRTCSTWC